MDLHKEVLKYKDEFIKSLQESIRIKSVEEETKPGMPFGEGPAKALEHFLSVGEKLGFKVENFDNYAGHIDFGNENQEEMVGILGHVDVVPEGNGWDFDPYGAEIVDNKMYGRGTLDDKGPMMICLYAMKALKDAGIPLKRKVRMILGANEETGWGCMNHYFGKLQMPHPVVSFTPDSGFPVTFAEKGILRGLFKIKTDADIFVKAGNVFNAVPETTTISLPISYKEVIEKELPIYNENKENKISFEILENKIILTSKGVAAHAAHPSLGYNSLSALMIFLGKLSIAESGLKEMVKFFNEKIQMEFNGKLLGLNLIDEPSGEITINFGKCYIENGELIVSMDMRYPVTFEAKDIKEKLFSTLNEYGLTFEPLKEEKPLYVPKDNFLVKTLMEVYQDMTGDMESQPISTGGGTYAKAVSNCVAFGALLKDTPDSMHQKNECIDLKTLDTLLPLFVETIYRLAK
ncbi:dipeptidase PepV [Fusobacterium sp.]|uniref:dipeptidase PepV n=1 Tax=Fusobacterium sp. TaxID=68766 RepID=UPI00262D2AE8|nr:dipeptidase PepV [Fusobacterium sp.]